MSLCANLGTSHIDKHHCKCAIQTKVKFCVTISSFMLSALGTKLRKDISVRVIIIIMSPDLLVIKMHFKCIY